MTRMRTIDAAIAQLRKDDPGSCVTRHALRQMILSGKVPHIRAGNKYLINYDKLLDVLAGDAVVSGPEKELGVIRRIE